MLTRENMLNGTFVRVHEALLPANMRKRAVRTVLTK